MDRETPPPTRPILPSHGLESPVTPCASEGEAHELAIHEAAIHEAAIHEAAIHEAAIHEESVHNDRHHELQLVARLRASDSVAFADVMQQYANLLNKFAFYILGSKDAAEDVVQQVFIQVWERRSSLDPLCRLKPYLFRAVRNRALNARDANHVRDRYAATTQFEASFGNRLTVVPSPEGHILTQAAVQTAIDQLPPRRRLAVRLRLEEEMTHAEIAEILDVSAEAAQRLVARAIADLREILDERV